MKTVSTIPEFEAALPSAITRVGQLIQDYPGDPMLESIKRQLEHVAIWTQDHRGPADEQLAKLSFGIMASKVVQELDEECAQLLHELSYFLHNWPKP